MLTWKWSHLHFLQDSLQVKGHPSKRDWLWNGISINSAREGRCRGCILITKLDPEATESYLQTHSLPANHFSVISVNTTILAPYCLSLWSCTRNFADTRHQYVTLFLRPVASHCPNPAISLPVSSGRKRKESRLVALPRLPTISWNPHTGVNSGGNFCRECFHEKLGSWWMQLLAAESDLLDIST